MTHPSRYLPVKAQKPIRGTMLNKTHPLARGLLGCWLFNEGTGERICDLSNSEAGDLIFYASNPPTWEVTKKGFGPYHDGSTLYAYGIVAESSPDPGTWHDAISAMSWFFLATVSIEPSGGPSCLWKEGGNTIGVAFGYRYSPDTICMAVVTSGTDDELASTTTFAPSDEVIGICGVVDGTDIRLYINGVLEDQGVISAITTHSADPLMLGSDGTCAFSGPYEWGGHLVTAYRYGRVLSAEEIAWLYREPYCMF